MHIWDEIWEPVDELLAMSLEGKGQWEPPLDRDHPDLVAVIEALGSEVSSGNLAEILIVEVPDDIDWTLMVMDWAEEWIAERHRTWPGGELVPVRRR